MQSRIVNVMTMTVIVLMMFMLLNFIRVKDLLSATILGLLAVLLIMSYYNPNTLSYILLAIVSRMGVSSSIFNNYLMPAMRLSGKNTIIIGPRNDERYAFTAVEIFKLTPQRPIVDMDRKEDIANLVLRASTQIPNIDDDQYIYVVSAISMSPRIVYLKNNLEKIWKKSIVRQERQRKMGGTGLMTERIVKATMDDIKRLTKTRPVELAMFIVAVAHGPTEEYVKSKVADMRHSIIALATGINSQAEHLGGEKLLSAFSMFLLSPPKELLSGSWN